MSTNFIYNMNIKKGFSGIFTASLLYTVAHTLPLYAGNNSVFDPNAIFEVRKGKKTTLSHRTTNAVPLQKTGINGQLKNGKRLTAAIIDICFSPEYTKDLKKKACLSGCHIMGFELKYI